MKKLIPYAIAIILFYGILLMLLDCWEREMQIQEQQNRAHIKMMLEERK